VLGALRSMPVAGALPCCAIATAGKVRKMTGASLCCPSWAKTRSEAPDEMPVWAFQPYTEGTVFGTDEAHRLSDAKPCFAFGAEFDEVFG
jgi:hypothetical protein